MFCPSCNAARQLVETLMKSPWEYLVSRYEFMIVFSSFHRNITFYSNMDTGQLKNLYSQIVTFSPARILTMDTLTAVCEKKHRHGADLPLVPWELSRVITLAIGNRVPEQFVRKCMSTRQWRGYEQMVLAAFASAECVRAGVMKYMALLKESPRNVRAAQTIIALAITGWMAKLSNCKCTCGVWEQALEFISCSVPDAETTLTIQDEGRVSAYICTLLELPPAPNTPQRAETSKPLDYGYIFRDLLVNLDSDEDLESHH